nr:hypothetical protein [uncultured Oscillibacter sp.]
MVTPQQGSRRDPAKRSRWEEEEQGSGRSFHRKAETELSGLCDDDMQEQGVSKILTINLNDMAKELKIK